MWLVFGDVSSEFNFLELFSQRDADVLWLWLTRKGVFYFYFYFCCCFFGCGACPDWAVESARCYGGVGRAGRDRGLSIGWACGVAFVPNSNHLHVATYLSHVLSTNHGWIAGCHRDESEASAVIPSRVDEVKPRLDSREPAEKRSRGLVIICNSPNNARGKVKLDRHARAYLCYGFHGRART